MFSELAEKLQVESDKLPAAVNEMSKAAAGTILRDLTLLTPVDVGTAISNWQVTLESPALDVIPAYAPSPRGRTLKGIFTHLIPPDTTRANNAPAVMDAGQSVIDAKIPGQEVFISNALPYIQSLNEGNSTQAPSGFVDHALGLAQTIVDSGLKLG